MVKPRTIILCILGFLLLDYAAFVYAWETAAYPPREPRVCEVRLNSPTSEVTWIDDPVYGKYVAVNHDTGWTLKVNAVILTTNKTLLQNITYEYIYEANITTSSYVYWNGKIDLWRQQ